MTVIDVTEDNLLSVLTPNMELEKYPEPYRSNGDMELVISFEVYKNFIEKYLGTDNYLSTDSITLKYFLNNPNQQRDNLLCCFYKDMAVGVVKEIWYTPVNSNPTKLTHKVSNGMVHKMAYIRAMVESFQDYFTRVQSMLLEYMSNQGYKLNRAQKDMFKAELDYATFLYDASFQNSIAGSRPWSLERSSANGITGVSY